MKMKLAELISVATRRLGSLWVVDFGEPGVFIPVFILEDVASDKRLDVTSVISLWMLFKIVLQKAWLLILKSLRSWKRLVSQEQENNNASCFSWLNSWQVAPRFTLVDSRTSFRLFPNVWRASGSRRRSMLGYVVAQMEQREDFLGDKEKEHVRV